METEIPRHMLERALALIYTLKSDCKDGDGRVIANRPQIERRLRRVLHELREYTETNVPAEGA